MAEYYRAVSASELWALDLTTDFRIPVIAAVSARDGRDWLLGFGADLDPATAASKALTEMNQMLPAALAGRAPAIATAELSEL